jgi:hypothetical protein
MDLTDEQRQTDVTVYVKGLDEAYAATGIREVCPSSPLNGVLDYGHPHVII